MFQNTIISIYKFSKHIIMIVISTYCKIYFNNPHHFNTGYKSTKKDLQNPKNYNCSYPYFYYVILLKLVTCFVFAHFDNSSTLYKIKSSKDISP